MAIEKRELGTDSNPDVMPMGRAMEVTPEPSRQDLIREAAEILVTDDGILVDNEIDAPPEGPPAIPFDANLVDFVDDNDLMILAKETIASIENDKESRSDWEKTYLGS